MVKFGIWSVGAPGVHGIHAKQEKPVLRHSCGHPRSEVRRPLRLEDRIGEAADRHLLPHVVLQQG